MNTLDHLHLLFLLSVYSLSLHLHLHSQTAITLLMLLLTTLSYNNQPNEQKRRHYQEGILCTATAVSGGVGGG